MFYKLDPETKETTPVKDPKESYFDTPDRIVAREEYGGVLLSTVFLHVDHNYCGGKPILFETMIFLGGTDIMQKRYHTWHEALEGHKYIKVAYVEEELVPKLRKTQSYRRLKHWLASSGINRSQKSLRRVIPHVRHAILQGAH